MKKFISITTIICLFVSFAYSQSENISNTAKSKAATKVNSEEGVSSEQMSKSNNPLANLNSVNFNNYYTSKIQGTTEGANTMFLRGVVVSGRQIIRATMPFVSLPSNEGYKSGPGDFNIFDAIKLTGDSAKIQFGVGPFLSIPTATSNFLGAGKWQLGAASVIMKSLKGGHLLGALTTYQHSIIGYDNRSETSPFSISTSLNLKYG